MAPHYNLSHATRPYPFMTCVVKVDVDSYWQKYERTAAKVLNACHGVHNFRMDDEGLIEVSGTVDPSVLLKLLGRAGRSAKICWIQSGECSSNLYMPTSVTESGRSTYSRDGRYLQPTGISRPQLPSHKALNNQGYGGYDHYANGGYYDHRYYSNANNHVYPFGYDARAQYQKQDYHHAHAQGYPYSYDDSQQSYDQYQSGYEHGGSQTRRGRSSGGDEMSCCVVM